MIASLSPKSSNPPLVAAVLHDWGETQSLRDSLLKLKQMGLRLKVLISGTSYSHYQLDLKRPSTKESPLGFELAEIITPDCLQLSVSTLPIHLWKSNSCLNDSDLLKVVQSIENMNPKLILSGCLSYLQQQLMEALPHLNKLIYYDNYKYPIDKNPRHSILKGCIEASNMVLLPSTPLSDELKSLYPDKKQAVVGHSQLEAMPELMGKLSADSVKFRLGIQNEKVLTFIGGYDEHGYYLEMFNSFIEELLALGELCSDPFTLIIQLHPRQFRHTNHELIEFIPCQKYATSEPRNRIIFSGGEERCDLKTAEALIVADLSLSIDSTVTLQAALAGIQSTYFKPRGSKIDENLLHKALPPVQSSTDIFDRLFNPPKAKDYECFYHNLGIPPNSSNSIAKILREEIFR